jgi:hypothetical protein
MCSTPKPKRKFKTETINNTVGILSSLNSENRRAFALRANQASDRCIEREKLKIFQNKHLNKPNIKINTKKKAKTVSNWLYIILNTSVSDIADKIATKLLRSFTQGFIKK